MPNTREFAYACAWSLALTLMVTIVVFQAGDGSFGVMPETEYDGEESTIVHTFDPYAA